MSDLGGDYLTDHPAQKTRKPNHYHISPANILRRADRAARGHGQFTPICRFPPCGKPFRTDNKFERYCCDSHRTRHLAQDNVFDSRGKHTRHGLANSGDGDGSKR